jgi:AGCS family alanine or glycine:cation symporter
MPEPVRSEAGWNYPDTVLGAGEWQDQEPVLMIVEAGENEATGQNIHRISGVVSTTATGFVASWQTFDSETRPEIVGRGFYQDHVGATLTAKAFDSVAPGLGKWLITIASWLFAISTIIAWGYYGEQGAVYMMGNRSAMPYRIIYCSLMQTCLSAGYSDTRPFAPTGITSPD